MSQHTFERSCGLSEVCCVVAQTFSESSRPVPGPIYRPTRIREGEREPHKSFGRPFRTFQIWIMFFISVLISNINLQHWVFLRRLQTRAVVRFKYQGWLLPIAHRISPNISLETYETNQIKIPRPNKYYRCIEFYPLAFVPRAPGPSDPNGHCSSQLYRQALFSWCAEYRMTVSCTENEWDGNTKRSDIAIVVLTCMLTLNHRSIACLQESRWYYIQILRSSRHHGLTLGQELYIRLVFTTKKLRVLLYWYSLILSQVEM